MTVLLTILKVIGWILLGILGLILLTVLTVLLVPIRYWADGVWKEGKCRLNGFGNQLGGETVGLAVHR